MFRSLVHLVLALAMLAPAVSPVLLAGRHPGRSIAAHSRVTFAVTKWGFAEVEGRFHDFSGSIAYHPDNRPGRTSHGRCASPPSHTGDVKRDQSLEDAEYFDAARHPELRSPAPPCAQSATP